MERKLRNAVHDKYTFKGTCYSVFRKCRDAFITNVWWNLYVLQGLSFKNCSFVHRTHVCVCVFGTVLGKNSDYSPILIGFHDRDGVFTARYEVM
jgi:hypothetical protein